MSVEHVGPLSRVHCHSEDGDLREVVFGRLEDFRLPEYDRVWDFAGPKMVSLLKTSGGKLFSEADPDWYGPVHEQIETVVGFLEDRGVVVHRPRAHTPDEAANFALQSACNINTYSRDSLVAIGDTLVETAFRTPERLRNKYAVRYVSMGLMGNGNRVLSMPQPLDTYEHDEGESPLVEGGDVEIDGENIYIGNSGEASNSLGVTWFKNAFPDFEVHEIAISTERFPHQHLDCVLVAFSTWGCALMDDIVGGYDSLPEPLKKKKWIALRPEEAHDKLGNFIALNPEEVVMAAEAERLGREVERLGIKVHRFPYYEVGKIGGSLRCNTCPIFRA